MFQKLIGRLRIFLTVIMATILAAGFIKAGMDFTATLAFKIMLAVYCVLMFVCSTIIIIHRMRQE